MSQLNCREKTGSRPNQTVFSITTIRNFGGPDDKATLLSQFNYENGRLFHHNNFLNKDNKKFWLPDYKATLSSESNRKCGVSQPNRFLNKDNKKFWRPWRQSYFGVPVERKIGGCPNEIVFSIMTTRNLAFLYPIINFCCPFWENYFWVILF